MNNKKTIFLTGATGNMGKEVLKQLLQRRDKFVLNLLVLPTQKDRKAIASYEHLPEVNIIWGDLTNYEDVFKGVIGAEYVLHVGGMVSPMADYHPDRTMNVNVGGTRNIIKAIKNQPDPDQSKLVYIGTVAQYGDRNPPIHWGRTGDPVKISYGDHYALSKTIAEREVIESGLKHWVSLRQTAILHKDLLKNLDPIMFHQPLNGVFEWVTAVDSGRLLVNLCERDLPESFWRRIYNIGGGKKYRAVNWELIQMTFKAFGIKDFKKVFESNWFATQNFHGLWYEDSHLLEGYLQFRSGSLEDFFDEVKKEAPFYLKFGKFAPTSLLKNLLFKPVAAKPHGPLEWIKNNDQKNISAYFESKEKWEKISGWNQFEFENPSQKPLRLDHGYDESKPHSELDFEDMKQAAEFRGGMCMSGSMEKGDLTTKLKWQCAFGHTFEASPTLILLGGHWCPHCLPSPWNYDEEAKQNPFFAQVWKPLHSESI